MKTITCVAIGILSFALPLRATVNVVDYWHLGENDPGAVAGAAMTNSVDILGSAALTNSGVVTYSSNVSTNANAETGSYLALQFTDNAYATSQAVPHLTNNFGVEAWVNPASTSGFQSILYNGNTGESGWGLYVAGNQFAGLFGAKAFIFGSVTFTPGTWNHVALVESGGTATLYVNGAVSGTLVISPNNPADQLTVGANQNGTENFPGLIDEIRVFTFEPGQFSTNDLLLGQSPSYNLAMTNIQVSGSAGSSNVALTVSPSSALWTASTTDSWLHLPVATGMGSATIPFTFDTDVGFPPRAGNIIVAGQSVTILQGPQVVVTNLLEGSGTGIETVPVFFLNYLPGALSATANASWLHISPNGAHASPGNTNVVFTLDANTNAAPRTGTLTIQGTTVTVTQAGSNYQAAGQMLFLDLSAYLATNGLVDFGPLPQGLAVDPDGNLYIAMNSRIFNVGFFGPREMPGFGDDPTGFILKWSTNNSFSVLAANPGEPILFPLQVALDPQTNVYFNDAGGVYDAIFERSAATGNVTQKIKVAANETIDSGCFVVDSAGNIFFAADSEPATPITCFIYELSAFDHSVTRLEAPEVGTTPLAPLIDSLAMDPFGFRYFTSGGIISGTDMNYEPYGTTPRTASAMAFDDSGNLYLSSADGLFKLSPTDFGSDFEGVPISSLQSLGLAVDKDRNIFGSDFFNTGVWIIPHAFVNAVPKWENGLAGNDSLPAVLPASASLNAQFAPTSDQPWLAITGVTNGVVSYSFTANLGTSNRVAHINVLGVPVTIRQSVIVTPPVLTVAGSGPAGGANIQINFTNNPNATFTVLTTTNLGVPLATWTVAGAVTNLGGGLFQFIAPGTNTQQFYRVRSP